MKTSKNAPFILGSLSIARNVPDDIPIAGFQLKSNVMVSQFTPSLSRGTMMFLFRNSL
jgi:hypothetical protein